MEFSEIEKRINTCSTAKCLAKQVKYALTILAEEIINKKGTLTTYNVIISNSCLPVI